MKMFSKKDDTQPNERERGIEEFGKIAENWNLENIQTFMRGQLEKNPVNDAGLAYIIKRFNERRTADKKAPDGKRREFEAYDRAERTKKGLTMVLSIIARKELLPESFPLIEEFLKIYSDVIQAFDAANEQTFEHKLKETYMNANVAALAKSKLKADLARRYD